MPARPEARYKACVDVDYRAHEAIGACLLFEDWGSAHAAHTVIRRVAPVAPYVPGAFYQRELPCLLATLQPVLNTVDTLIVDGYVWLDEHGRRGLGAHLHAALAERVPVVGVAKTAFRGAPAVEVRRGASQRPLYVTAAGLPAETAAQHVRAMHGAHRLPELLKQVDQACRRA